MSIQDRLRKINPQKSSPDIETVSYTGEGEVVAKTSLKRFFLPLVLVLVVLLGFGIGRLSGKEAKLPVKIEYDESLFSESSSTDSTKPKADSSIVKSPTPTSPLSGETVVGSSKSDKYHYLDCPGAKQISDANKITFKSATAAEAAGYTLALNCKPR